MLSVAFEIFQIFLDLYPGPPFVEEATLSRTYPQSGRQKRRQFVRAL